MRIGILVVAYNAESTLAKTISRIPKSVYDKIFEILISDDQSSDKTSKIAHEVKYNSNLPIRVITHPINLGYGGNQKFGYAWAIENNWDVVVLLHADGQYAPEYLENLFDPILTSKVDAVFGSRMINKRNALSGGMPFYKWIGNQILTRIQNLLTRQEFHEWHSGYRAYKVETLRKINFQKLSNGFRFDTQIILELISQKANFAEIDIPTFYGDEISHVNGLEYAREIIWDTMKFAISNRVSK
jgi:glycosyltransferase involved in cell wall biosynthesis